MSLCPPLVRGQWANAEIKPAPTQNLQIGKIGLPKLVYGRCLMLKFIRGFQHDESRAGDQVMRLERAIHCRFRHKVALLIGERDSQLAR